MTNNKNSVRLLPKIERFKQYTAFFTEFETNYEVGDKVYIMSLGGENKILDGRLVNRNIDSFSVLDTTYDSIGYKILEKSGNKIVLDILYDSLEYIPPELLLDYTVWELGPAVDVGQFIRVGAQNQSDMITIFTPFGNKIVWSNNNLGTTGFPNNKVGFNTIPISIDNTKMYRFSMWVNRIGTGSLGFDWSTWGEGTVDGLRRKSDNELIDIENDNRFENIFNVFPDNGFWLVVGHVWPSGSPNGSNHPDTGLWDFTGDKITDADFEDWIWLQETTHTKFRAVSYKFLSPTRRHRFLYPRIDVIDGTEPSISDLVNGYDDLVLESDNGNGNGDIPFTDNNYVGRVYIKEGNINRGSISGSMLYNVKLQPSSAQSLLWNQGILVDTPDNITNIDFNSKTRGQLILKSQFVENELKNYYTVDNDNIGLSIINFTDSIFILSECNINAGVFNNCQFSGANKLINNGIFNNCIVGSSYIINNGIFNNSTLLNDTVIWNNGRWNNDWETSDPPPNPFRAFVWENGTWENGIFPPTSVWQNGRFLNGTFNGSLWSNGTFGSKNGSPVFDNSNWQNGFFYGNNSVFRLSTWNGGIFDNGNFENSNWVNGEFNNGNITGSTWQGGNFNNGNFRNSTWENGEFNDGIFLDSIWNGGEFNGGVFIDSTWNDGNFYRGSFEDSDWLNGNFYKGSMFTSSWHDGTLHFGIMNNITWSGGTWLNGIANNIEWLDGEWFNGVWNFGNFNKGIWYNGSFNNGVFGGVDNDSDSIWKFGNFYEGTFKGVWEGGTFFIGDTGGAFVEPPQKLNRKFVQYNKKGLMSIRPVGRIPSKRRF